MNNDIEKAIRKALEGSQNASGGHLGDTPAPGRVAVESALSDAIAGNLDPETILRGTISLNDDNALAKMLGADTLEGKPL